MASKLFKTVKKKAGRLQDIVSVLQKLEEKKYVERLSKIFEEIFLEEQKFTVTELQRIMSVKATNKYMDLDEQFRQNTQLFKANFEVITGILINEVWDSVTNSFQKQDKAPQQPIERGRTSPLQEELQQYQQNTGIEARQDQQDGDQQEQQDEENEGHFESSQGISSPGQQNDSKVLNKLAVSRSQVVNNTSSGHLNHNNTSVNNYSINNSSVGQQENWVRSSMKKRTSSRSQENIKQQQQQSQSQQQMNDSQYSKRMNSMNNSSVLKTQSQSILDIKRQQEKRLSNMNLSVSSVKSLSQSKLGITSPFSEIQESKNPLQTSFSRAQRKLMDKELSQSPGPTDYKIDSADKLVRKSSPKASIGNTKRTNFIDEKQRIESCSQTPGPQYNVSQTAIYKPMKK